MLSLNVNGVALQVDVDPSTPLLWVLRDTLGLTGTKYGCGIEECGACTVLMDGQAQRTCEMGPDRSHPLQKAWLAAQVPQCGYCQSGMIMAAVALLQEHPHPTDADIDDAVDNICACGT